ncbi:MAG TPA: Bax inhibitor-1 family protein [Candidatus Saccharimonadales bacterium]
MLAVSLLGVLIAHASPYPAVSLIGYALVAGSFGLLCGPLLALYETSSILKVLAITGSVVLILGLIGALLPDDLSAWGLWLFGGLLLLIGAQFIVPLLGSFGIPVEGAMTLVDWIGLVVFGALVLYDLNRAVRLPYTHDNAVDSAVAIYLDFINIFIRLLAIMGQQKD